MVVITWCLRSLYHICIYIYMCLYIVCIYMYVYIHIYIYIHMYFSVGRIMILFWVRHVLGAVMLRVCTQEGTMISITHHMGLGFGVLFGVWSLLGGDKYVISDQLDSCNDLSYLAAFVI